MQVAVKKNLVELINYSIKKYLEKIHALNYIIKKKNRMDYIYFSFHHLKSIHASITTLSLIVITLISAWL